ncbi:uncharacterized protein LOC128951441 [Oppia nitens]|uniref:uncharacterized protein LOC128951441 n=1 Tax=Oppia nitens TaxID=1686743 RepID=UPI0023DC4EF8|nr:uncharacterized protein LOC128951441 [Oppia nitens]
MTKLLLFVAIIATILTFNVIQCESDAKTVAEAMAILFCSKCHDTDAAKHVDTFKTCMGKVNTKIHKLNEVSDKHKDNEQECSKQIMTIVANLPEPTTDENKQLEACMAELKKHRNVFEKCKFT